MITSFGEKIGFENNGSESAFDFSTKYHNKLLD